MTEKHLDEGLYFAREYGEDGEAGEWTAVEVRLTADDKIYILGLGCSMALQVTDFHSIGPRLTPPQE